MSQSVSESSTYASNSNVVRTPQTNFKYLLLMFWILIFSLTQSFYGHATLYFNHTLPALYFNHSGLHGASKCSAPPQMDCAYLEELCVVDNDSGSCIFYNADCHMVRNSTMILSEVAVNHQSQHLFLLKYTFFLSKIFFLSVIEMRFYTSFSYTPFYNIITDIITFFV